MIQTNSPNRWSFFFRTHIALAIFLPLFLVSLTSCGKSGLNPDPQEPEEQVETPDDTGETDGNNDESALEIYIPKEFGNMDFTDNTSKWSYARSKQSTHFIVFWEEGFGTNPNDNTLPENLRVDIDDLLEKVETFYDVNVNTLKFADVGSGVSNLDKYKMEIYLLYQTDWLATGSGYDDVIGALWVNPSTCQPVGSTIAHEIGHSFQYQVYADLIAYGGVSNDYTRGFRYGFGGNGGNAFWEQCAQWQSFQSYPEEAFTSYNFKVYTENYNRHVLHESYRYASYFMHYYWADKYGDDIIGRIWREAVQPEDPFQTYMRITGINDESLNDEIYDAATKFTTWDLNDLREDGSSYIAAQTYNYTELEDGSLQVAYDRCPGTTGYNVIPLKIPAAGTNVSTIFAGMVNADGFNQVSAPERAGWRYGYVALLEDGTRVYGAMNQGITNTVTYTIPENCSKLWFVITGAPTSYAQHPWDDDESNDDQWPYKLKFTNTDIKGHIKDDGSLTPTDLSLSYNVSFEASTTAYTGTTISVDATELAEALVVQATNIEAKMTSGEITFNAVEADGSLNAQTTANGYGHWFDANGNVCSWGEDAHVFSEFTPSSFTFSIGQYPNHCTKGDQYTIKQALVYEYETDKKVQITFVFNITLE